VYECCKVKLEQSAQPLLHAQYIRTV